MTTNYSASLQLLWGPPLPKSASEEVEKMIETTSVPLVMEPKPVESIDAANFPTHVEFNAVHITKDIKQETV